MTVRVKHLPAIYGYATNVQDEGRRLDELSEMQILDDLAGERIEQYTRLLADTLDMPVAFTEFCGGGKTRPNVVAGDPLSETERQLLQLIRVRKAGRLFIVDDITSDSHFADHHAVYRKNGVRFFAGSTLLGSNGGVLGHAGVLDYRHRTLTIPQTRFFKRTMQLIERELQGQEIVIEIRENIRSRILRDPITDLPHLGLFCERLDQRIRLTESNNTQCLVAAIRLARYDMLENAIGRPGTAYLIGKIVERMNTRIDREFLVGQIREDEIVVAKLWRKQSLSWDGLLATISDCFREPFSFGDETFIVTADIGASRYPIDTDNSAGLVRKARIALRSRNTTASTGGYRVFSESFSVRSDDQFRLESALARGLSNGEFYVVYQPIIDLRTGRIRGAEALVRWKSPELGELLPNHFIPTADRIGLLSEIGNFVTTTVCGHLSHWKSTRLKHLSISLNVSNSQLRDAQFGNRIIDLVEENGINGDKLCLEITEESLIEDPLQVIKIMESLRKNSISFSIDDFGTGFSSLNYLRMMPLSILKIDRSFVTDIPNSRDSLVVAQSIIALGHGLGLTIVAEGVENGQQLEWLKAQGCDEIQGFVFSKPLVVDQFEQLAISNPVFVGKEVPGRISRKQEHYQRNPSRSFSSNV